MMVGLTRPTWWWTRRTGSMWKNACFKSRRGDSWADFLPDVNPVYLFLWGYMKEKGFAPLPVPSYPEEQDQWQVEQDPYSYLSWWSRLSRAWRAAPVILWWWGASTLSESSKYSTSQKLLICILVLLIS